MNLRLVCLLLLLAGLGVSTSGCLAVAVGAGAAGTVAYMRGDLEAEEPYSIDQTYVATRTAVKGLGLTIIEGETGQDALGGHLTARDSSDKKVQVRLKAITSNATKLSVRVGTFGDKSKTQRIYNAIHDQLKATAPAPVEPPQPVAPTAEPSQPAATPAESSQLGSAPAESSSPATPPAEPSQPAQDPPQSPTE
jgi:hypothetical protein